MEEASRGFVNMDEMMDAVGKRLAELSGAEWGIVTAGCADALHLGRDRRRQFRSGDDGPLGTRVVAEAARRLNVPVVVDPAAESLTLKPNVHLERGATAVAYSGGKCIRDPQAGGLSFGQRSFLQAAWINSAPHHGFGRSLRVGKEKIMGMLADVEMWVSATTRSSVRCVESWLNYIADSVKCIDGVSTETHQPSPDLSSRSPELFIHWKKPGLTDHMALVGTHEGEFAVGDVTGSVQGHGVKFQSSPPTEGTRVSF